jgi:hypothetical protein
VQNICSEGFGNKETPLVKYHPVLSDKVGVTLYESFTPLLISFPLTLEMLQELRSSDKSIESVIRVEMEAGRGIG